MAEYFMHEDGTIEFVKHTETVHRFYTPPGKIKEPKENEKDKVIPNKHLSMKTPSYNESHSREPQERYRRLTRFEVIFYIFYCLFFLVILIIMLTKGLSL